MVLVAGGDLNHHSRNQRGTQAQISRFGLGFSREQELNATCEKSLNTKCRAVHSAGSSSLGVS